VSRTVAELRRAFTAAVKDCVADGQEQDLPPEKPAQWATEASQQAVRAEG